jgi:hypothetical protein
MTKTENKPTTPKSPRKRKARVAKTHKATLINKLQRINCTLGTLLAPRYATVGTTFSDNVKLAQDNVVAAGLAAHKLADDWAPAVKRLRVITPERLKQMREQAAKLAARIAEAEAAS